MFLFSRLSMSIIPFSALTLLVALWERHWICIKTCFFYPNNSIFWSNSSGDGGGGNSSS